jgi:hypothetical protein
MTTGPERQLPDWARRERLSDLEWINENLQLFWPMAQAGYEAVGRGSIWVDTTITVSHDTGAGNPMGYVDQQTIEEIGDEDTQRLVREYLPQREFVTTLFKPQERMSSYRISLVRLAKPRQDSDPRLKPE